MPQIPHSIQWTIINLSPLTLSQIPNTIKKNKDSATQWSKKQSNQHNFHIFQIQMLKSTTLIQLLNLYKSITSHRTCLIFFLAGKFSFNTSQFTKTVSNPKKNYKKLINWRNKNSLVTPQWWQGPCLPMSQKYEQIFQKNEEKMLFLPK